MSEAVLNYDLELVISLDQHLYLKNTLILFMSYTTERVSHEWEAEREGKEEREREKERRRISLQCATCSTRDQTWSLGYTSPALLHLNYFFSWPMFTF